MRRVGNGPELTADLVAKLGARARRGGLRLRMNIDKRFFASPTSMKKTSYYQRQVIIIALMLMHPVHSALLLNIRNQAKLQARQREYARRKRAPGLRKVSKVERQLLEKRYAEKQSLMEMEGLSQAPSTESVCSLLSGHLGFTQTSRVYKGALIVRSQLMDPRRTLDMIEKEEKAREHFEELKDILLMFSPSWWKEGFKSHVDKFIGERLIEKELVAAIPCKDEEEEENDRIHLHGLRRLVAGAVQEWELAQQPEHAAECAKLDRALVWQGRGYVGPILPVISSL
jgi:hypothetical protein